MFLRGISILIVFAIGITVNCDLVNNQVHFTKHFYGTLASQNPGKSVVLSPASLQTAFALLSLGAKGNTADELVTGFHLEPNAETRTEEFKQLVEIYKKNEQVVIASKVYIDTHAEVLPEFKQLANEKFNSEVETTSLTDGAQSAKTLNDWVKEKTNGKIEKLIDSDDCDTHTRLILLNTIYFKGNWKYPFDKTWTKKQPFWISENESIDVDTMRVETEVKYKRLRDQKVTLIELPYADSDLTLSLAIPFEKDGLAELESKLVETDYIELNKEMRQRKVELTLPKFKIETEIDLKDALKPLGVEDAFNDGDFSGLAKSDKPIRINKAIHKVLIDVDEEGTEAAAGSAATHLARLGPLPVKVDRPFLFCIKDSQNHILFAGRYTGK